jgi:hypothetical protein
MARVRRIRPNHRAALEIGMVTMNTPQHHRMLSEFADLLGSAPRGPRLELGVCNGESLLLMAQHDSMTIGVDSFEGMGEPSAHDITAEGVNQYPKGRLRADYLEVSRRFAHLKDVEIIKGWIPEVLLNIPTVKFAFVHVDLDHYVPTVSAIDWCWSRMSPHGILCCDDYFPDCEILASLAIKEAIRDRRPIDGVITRKCYWRF